MELRHGNSRYVVAMSDGNLSPAAVAAPERRQKLVATGSYR